VVPKLGEWQKTVKKRVCTMRCVKIRQVELAFTIAGSLLWWNWSQCAHILHQSDDVIFGHFSLRTKNAKFIIRNCWHTQFNCIRLLVCWFKCVTNNKYFLAMGNMKLSYKVRFKLRTCSIWIDVSSTRSDMNKQCVAECCKQKGYKMQQKVSKHFLQ
jgi:hypothetical protein